MEIVVGHEGGGTRGQSRASDRSAGRSQASDPGLASGSGLAPIRTRASDGGSPSGVQSEHRGPEGAAASGPEAAQSGVANPGSPS
eukprot:58817-Prorocentrum_minimum.AAC.1